MITVTSVADLPSTVPAELKKLVVKSERALAASFQVYSWSSLTSMFFCFGHTDKTKNIHTAASMMEPSIDTGAERAVDILNTMALHGVPMVEGCRYHVGYGVMSEGISVKSQEVRDRIASTRGGRQMTELLDDMTATGEIKNWRMFVGVLASGWAYEVSRHRGEEGLRIDVYPVEEQPEHNEIYRILKDFNGLVPANKIKRRQRP